jgi:hypothetical protein
LFADRPVIIARTYSIGGLCPMKTIPSFSEILHHSFTGCCNV